MKKAKYPCVLVLGATGMLGRIIYKYLKTKSKNVFGTSRNKNDKELIYFNIRNGSISLDNIFERTKIDYVINCIGALEGSHGNKLNLLNVQLPKKILKASKKHNFKIIHISTDAVFSSDAGKVNEQFIPNPENQYGKSKLKGELPENTLNIRTSIIGFDPTDQKGLLEFVLLNKNKKIKGFINQKWSGSTTLQLARFIEWIISKNNFENLYKKTQIIHFSPLNTTTKYEIIKTFSRIKKINNVIISKGGKILRILYTKYFVEIKLDNYSDNLKNEIKKLIKFEKIYAKGFK